MQTDKLDCDALKAHRLKAELKIKRQSEVVAGLNGAASRFLEEATLLNEMLQNRTMIDLASTLLDGARDAEAPAGAPTTPTMRSRPGRQD